MATIGSMQVRLGIDTDQFRAGLRRAERRAFAFSSNVVDALRRGGGRIRALGNTQGQRFMQAFNRAADGASSLASNVFMPLAKSPIILVAGALAAASFLSAVAAGLTMGAAGLGVIGLAAVLLKEEPAIKSAAGKLKNTAVRVMRSAAQPMVKPLSQALGALEKTMLDLQPQFNKMFSTVAKSGALKHLTDGIDKLVKNAFPGFNKMLTQMKPAFEGLESVLSGIGEGLNLFFRQIATVGPEAKVALQDLGGIIRAVLSAAGQLIAYFARMYMTVRPVFKKISELFRETRDFVYPIVKFLTGNISMLFRMMGQKVISSVTGMVSRVVSRVVSMAARFVARITSLVTTVVGWFRKIPGRASSAISSLGSKIAGVARSAGSRFIGAVNTFISRMLGIVRRIPGRVKGAIGGLGGVLYGSGKALIRGFINGIKAMIGAAARAAGSVVSRVRNFFPFSPAKEGPFSGRGYTTYSGAALIDGFSQGVQARLPHLAKQLGAIGDGMPDMNARVSGVVRAAGRSEQRIVLDVQGGDEEMKRLIRRMVRVDGRGNVQTAFGY